MNNSYKREEYKPEIDGIRAFAVLAVILNHTSNKILPNGFLGVDIFFVISGFVLTLSLEGKQNKNFIKFFTNFFQRRIRRLFPALLFFCLISALLITFVNPSPQVSHITGITGLLGFSNLYLLKQSTDYFATETILNPFTHTWSLDVEEQFYLLFPFFIWFSGFATQKKLGKKNLLNLMLFFSSISLVIYIFLNFKYPISSYFLMPARFWEMGIGCILYLIYQKKNPFLIKIFSTPPFFSLFLILFVMLIPDTNITFNTISVVILTTILIGSIKKDTQFYKFFSKGFLNHLGLLSYSLYLWHWLVLSISAWTIGISWWTVPFQYLLIYFLSYLSFRFIEKPFRNNFLIINNSNVFLYAFTSLVSTVTFISLLSTTFKDYIFLGNKKLKQNYSEKVLWSYDKCSTSSRSNKLPNFTDLNQCWFKENDLDSKNLFKRNIFFYGSSYNQHLMSIPSEILTYSKNLKFNSYAATGCVATKYLNYASGGNEFCKQVFIRYLNFFLEFSNEGDKLVIANSYNAFIDNESLLKNYLKELEDLHINLDRNKRELIVVSPIPVINPNPKICSNWYARYNQDCEKKEIMNKKRNKSLKSINQKLIGLRNKKIQFINLFTTLEKKLKYDKYKENIYELYYNKSHLSKSGAQLFTEKFKTIFLNLKI